MTTKKLALILAVLFAVTICDAQGPQTGVPKFGSFAGGDGVDTINLGNLNVHMTVPLIHKAGRGMPFGYDVVYDNSVWYPAGVSGSKNWQPIFNFGWTSTWTGTGGYVTYSVSTTLCYDSQGHPIGATTYVGSWTFHDPWGVNHSFSGTIISNSCPGGPTNVDHFTSTTTDGSGLTMNIGVPGAHTIVQPDGLWLEPPRYQNAPPGGNASSTKTDANGNQITSDGTGHFTDTLGVQALTISGTSPVSFSYTGPAGAATYVLKYTPKTIRTYFRCSTVSDYGPVPNTNLVAEIDLPDYNQTTNPNSRYLFTYEPSGDPNNPGSVTGRLASVTLPTGGTIAYEYSGGTNGINCTDGTTPTLKRTPTPGGLWTYSLSGSGSDWTTTVTDPANNQSVTNFEKFGTNLYETQRLSYQGSTSGTLLRTDITCYNGQGLSNPSSCYNTHITAQITRVTSFTYLPNSAGLQSETDSTYDIFGLIHEVDEYDYGTGAVGPLLRKTVTNYTGGLGNGIVDRPSSVVIYDANDNEKANTSYGYDTGTPTATTGTPQHISVSGSRGLLTSVTAKTNGTINLYRKYTYYDTGTLSTSTDVSTSSATNGPQTTYNYSSTNNASCGNSFVTSISEPLSMSRSMTWDCNGGVMLSLTDENNNTSSTAYSGTNYTNYFWRPYSTTDQAGFTTNLFYYPYSTNQPSQTESRSATFNSGNSIVDVLTTADGFGRTTFSQTKQGPSASNYDTVATCYDSLGRTSFSSLPYSFAAITTGTSACPSGSAGTSTAYDALSRSTSITNGGGGSTSYTYSKNDVLQTVTSPTRSKQLEYDALGRLTSVCEITAGTTAFPGGICAQTSSPQPTGYYTTYTYDVLGNQTAVTQNAQAAPTARQTRAFLYDMLGRLTSETNPETKNSAVTYSYDSVSSDTACGTYTSAGNMLKRLDAAGNAACYSGYDAFHRVGTIIYPSSSTPAKHFVYDTATVNGTSMANAKTRLAEAYTCIGTCSSKVTDLGFSYRSTGQTTDVWELTPHSGTNYYYHVTGLPWPNGALNTLSNLSGLPTITYSTDGEGRQGTTSASSGQPPVTAITYNAASNMTALTYGSGDTDSFTFNPSTGRMATYTFSVNAKSNSGTLTWNPNSTLQQLLINDQIPGTSDSQTCTYTHDDLGRVTSSDCGCSKWSQTFAYDPFGNVTKTVPQFCTGTSFQVSYDYTNNTNRITTSPYSYTSTADPNAKTGNMTADNSHVYEWDVDGRVTAIDPGTSSGICLIYDALGRAVEQAKGSACNTSPTSSTQIVYAPSGAKLALMNGSSLVKAFVPLPGGAQAVYNSSGIQYYRHPDWLGSSRLASTASRTPYFTGAYAPFGENYAQTGTQDLAFTGQNQDTEASAAGGAGGLYDFLFREQSPAQGRWLSPDPAGIAAASPSDPQTWNRYAYVRNMPTSLTDPLGLVCDAGPGCGCDHGQGDRSGGSPSRAGGVWPGNETLGLPQGLNSDPIDLNFLLTLVPGLNCPGTGANGFVAGSTYGSGDSGLCLPRLVVSLPISIAGAAHFAALPVSAFFVKECLCYRNDELPEIGHCSYECRCTDNDNYIWYPSVKDLTDSCHRKITRCPSIVVQEGLELPGFGGVTSVTKCIQ
jgi:RHS repeat-associated protein